MKENNEITPAALLTDFSGRGLKGMIIFTIVVHVVLILASSGSYIKHLVTGTDTSKLGESERLELAVKEASLSLKEIAQKHGLKPQDLSEQFESKAPKAPKAESEATTPETPEGTAPKEEIPKTGTPEGETPAVPEKPKSELEKEISTKAEGPKLPPVEEEVDLFK